LFFVKETYPFALAGFPQRRKGLTSAAELIFRVLVAWIVIQVYWFVAFHWLRVLYLALGLLEFVLGWLLRKVLRREVD